MSRLYPPNIAGTISSFYSDSEGTTLVVPFSMNKTVSISAVSGFSIRIKSSSTDVVLGIFTSLDWNPTEASLSVNFLVPESIRKKLTIGKFYKIQIAYVEQLNQLNKTPIVGYYSTVGIVKYTAKPKLEITGFNSMETNINITEYIGAYHNMDDPTEKAYQYKFTLFAQNNTIIETSGWKLHNVYADESALESVDSYNIMYALDENTIYKIQYSVITNNGLEINSPKYLIMLTDSIKAELKASLEAILDYDNGCVNLKLVSKRNEDGSEDAATGAFILTRASSENNFASWVLISTFRLRGQLPSTFLFKDYTVEQGATYRYALQQFNDAKVYSNRILAPDINVYFEDAFLFDGKRQLKIRFNPKVSSFKTIVLESKKTTLGGKYPFLFRNGAVSYKEFPISGLISYLMDNDEFFLSRVSDLNANPNLEYDTRITDENIALERKFKLEVLDWLNNGEIKLFKSPGEGNYLVRLMGVSLTPNDTTSRMIHTFNCTASEVADFSPENLIKYNLLLIGDIEIRQMRWGSILLDDFIEDIIKKHTTGVNATPEEITAAMEEVKYTDLLKTYGCYHLKVTDCVMGALFKLGSLNLLVGATGLYEAMFETPLRQLYLVNPTRHMPGNLTYGIMSTTLNKFDTVNSVTIHDLPVHEVYGPNKNILDTFVNIKYNISKIYYAHFFRILTQDVPSLSFLLNIAKNKQNMLSGLGMANDNLISKDMTTNDLVHDSSYYDNVLSPYIVYHLMDINAYCKYDPIYNNFNLVPDYSTEVIFGNTKINLIELDDVYVPDLSLVPQSISIGSGIYAEIGLQLKEIGYSAEAICKQEKTEYLNALEKYDAHILSFRLVPYGTDVSSLEACYAFDNGRFKRLEKYQIEDLQKRDIAIWTIADESYSASEIGKAYDDCMRKKKNFLDALDKLLKELESELL